MPRNPRSRRARPLRAHIERLEPRRLLDGRTLYIEGEDYTESGFLEHSWYTYSRVDPARLSPGTSDDPSAAMLSHYRNNLNPVEAAWELELDEPGTFTWWVRINSHSGLYSVSINDGPWEPIATSDGAGAVNLLHTNPGDIRSLEWVPVGEVDLQAGLNRIEIQVGPGPGRNNTHGIVDALVFTEDHWVPSGSTPFDPDREPAGPDDWFRFAAGPDPDDGTSLIDMSGLLEDQAGSHGPLKSVEDRLVFEDGTPAKFWGVGAAPPESDEAIARQARFFAKHGINLARIHPVTAHIGRSIPDGQGGLTFDADKLDRFDRWFAALKDQGIYMTWSVFYPLVITPEDGYDPTLYNELRDDSFDGRAGKSTSGIVTMMPELQDLEWNYLRILLEHVNPYTGLAYKDDPALAFIETRNESNLFFHAPLNDLFDNSMPRHAQILREQFGAWVKDRYATEDDLNAAWGTRRRPLDDWDAGVFDIMGSYHLGADGPLYEYNGQTARAGDFIQFLAEIQRDSYLQRQDRLRSLGYQGIVVGSNWKSGGPAGATANLWSDAAVDAIDRHGYDGGQSGHRIDNGVVDDSSTLGSPMSGLFSTGLWQIEDRPFGLSEWTMKTPNAYRAEAAPIMAFYGLGLQDWDFSIQFTAGDASFYQHGWPDLSAYPNTTPTHFGQYPALAFAVHNEHIAPGDVVDLRRVDLDDVFSGTDPLDQNIENGYNDTNIDNPALGTPTAHMAVGRVTVEMGDVLPDSEHLDVEPYWDRDAGRITSTTGQLVWDYDERRIEVRSEQTQGLVGFAEEGPAIVALPDAEIRLESEFASLILTPLDNRPLDESQQILVTALARDRLSGTTRTTDPDGTTRITEVGEHPLLLEPVRAQIRLDGPAITSVRPLDFYGAPKDMLIPVGGDGSFAIDGRYETFYYVIDRLDDSTPTTLTVAQSTPHTDGIAVQFNDSIDLAMLNLYGSDGPDVTLEGPGGPVRGSLVVDEAGHTLRFLATDGPLEPGTHSLTIRSAFDAVRRPNGELLDGDGDGTPGGDHVVSFEVTPFDGATLQLPHFARGAGQSVDLPVSTSGIPLTISNADGADLIAFDLEVDSELLEVIGAVPGADLADDASLDVTTIAPGRLRVTVSVPDGLATGTLELVRIVGEVPSSAPIASKHVLKLDQPVVEAGGVARSVRTADGFHLAAYLGDTFVADLSYSTQDIPVLIEGAFGLGDGALADYPNADPRLVTDVNGNGIADLEDVTSVLLAALGQPSPSLPPRSSGPVPVPGGLDPVLALSDVQARPGDSTRIPLTLTITDTVPVDVRTFRAIVQYDADLLRIADIAIGGLGQRFRTTWHVDEASGLLVIVGFRLDPLPLDPGVSGTLAWLEADLAEDLEPESSVALNLRADVPSVMGRLVTGLNGGQLVLDPAPTNAEDDPVDGRITVLATRDDQALDTVLSSLTPMELTRFDDRLIALYALQASTTVQPIPQPDLPSDEDD